MSKHTQGPWHIDGSVIRSANLHEVFSVPVGLVNDVAAARCPSRQEAKANARLIAAAPELLNALKLLRDSYAGGYSAEIRASCWKQAQEAIAKAEGTQ